MKIDHIACWVIDLEKTTGFYAKYFGAVPGPEYHNPDTGFRSRFLSFSDGCRLELMQRDDIREKGNDLQNPRPGIAHFAISVGSREKVDKLTNRLREDGYTVFGEPRTTGDGYYESNVLDLDGNLVEITV